MEKDLLTLFELADSLNANQDEVYAQITYYANNSKTIEITIWSKKDYSYIEECQLQLQYEPAIKLKMITDLFASYVGGATNE